MHELKRLLVTMKYTLCLFLSLSAFSVPALALPKVQPAKCNGDIAIAAIFDSSTNTQGYGIGGGNSLKFAALLSTAKQLAALFTYDLLVDQFRGVDIVFQATTGHIFTDSSVIFCFLDPATGAIFKEEIKLNSAQIDRVPNVQDLSVAAFRRNNFSNQLIKDGKAACIGTLVVARTDNPRPEELIVGKATYYGSDDFVPKVINTEVSRDCKPFNNCPAPPPGAKQRLRINAIKERVSNRRPN